MVDARLAPDTSSRGRWLAIVPALAFLGLAALFLLRLGAGDASKIPSALIGKMVPTFVLPALEGMAAVPGFGDTDLRDGHVTVVNVFASWCVPCRQEHPILTDLSRDKVRVVGIAYKDEPENTRRFLGSNGNPYGKVGVDRAGRTAIDFGVTGVPETFVVKGDGTIAYKYFGPLTPDALRDELLPAIRKASGT